MLIIYLVFNKKRFETNAISVRLFEYKSVDVVTAILISLFKTNHSNVIFFVPMLPMRLRTLRISLQDKIVSRTLVDESDEIDLAWLAFSIA